MALTSYVSIDGETQGNIKGGCTQSGDKADKIMVYAHDHNIEIPNDTHTGQATGQRIHHEYKISKSLDVASPLLLNAIASGENLTLVHDIYEINDKGVETKKATITLSNAIITNLRRYTPETFTTEAKPYHDMEEVSIRYGAIKHEHIDGAITGEDSWTA